MPQASLPVELIVHVFTVLEAEELPAFRLVCKLFRDLIDSDVNIQYKIALLEACQVDCPSNATGPSKKLKTLRAHQHAWSRLDLSTFTDFEERNGMSWQLSGSILANTNFDKTYIKIRRLPSVLRGISWSEWSLTDFNFRFVCYIVDGTQDLLVLLQRLEQRGTIQCLHLRKASDGHDHPLEGGQGVTLFIPSTTIRKALDFAGSEFEIDIPWENWGSRGGLFSLFGSHCVNGTRVLAPNSQIGTRKVIIELIDFNPYAARRAQHNQDMDHNTYNILEGTAGAFFVDDALTTLAVTSITKRVIWRLTEFRGKAFETLMGQDSIVFIDDEGFRLFTF
ncbi:hypothetical protein HGRIS_004482 [Hohenbuehelia grisea]|uniref:F-box domain-containing protein n=1 Tax=Hohenbuehelia grisea TaxID=104357 RepID=A0ABR3JC63_9AGAR